MATSATGDECRVPNPSLFRRGLELQGQESVADPRFADSLQRYGIILVEGFADRIRLSELGVMAKAMTPSSRPNRPRR